MSVFFEYPTDLQSKAKGAVLATAFSNGDQHILAAATKNGDITMYLEEVSRRGEVGSGQRQRWHNHAPREIRRYCQATFELCEQRRLAVMMQSWLDRSASAAKSVCVS